jgi:hypothetical protein
MGEGGSEVVRATNPQLSVEATNTDLKAVCPKILLLLSSQLLSLKRLARGITM